jgi:hypothetical protein
MFTLAQLNALDAAIASGALVVEHDGKKVQYQNTQALLAARDVVRSELIATGQLATPTTPRVSFARRER